MPRRDLSASVALGDIGRADERASHFGPDRREHSVWTSRSRHPLAVLSNHLQLLLGPAVSVVQDDLHEYWRDVRGTDAKTQGATRKAANEADDFRRVRSSTGPHGRDAAERL